MPAWPAGGSLRRGGSRACRPCPGAVGRLCDCCRTTPSGKWEDGVRAAGALPFRPHDSPRRTPGGARAAGCRGGGGSRRGGPPGGVGGGPPGTAAWIDAASAHGTVRNELTPDPEAAAMGRSVELRLRANWADIIIRRAISAPRKELSP